MGDQPAQFTEEYCAEKMKIIALLIALLVAVAASSEISGDSNERVVPEESLVSEGLSFVFAPNSATSKLPKPASVATHRLSRISRRLFLAGLGLHGLRSLLTAETAS